MVAGSAIALVGSALPIALFLRGNATSLVGRAYGLTNRMARRAGRTGVVLQVAIAVTLVATAMLLASSLSRLLRIDLGLNPDRVLTGRVAFPRIQYATAADLRRFEREAVGAIGVLPDVAAAGLVSVLPMSGRHARFNLLIEGRPVPSHAGLPVAEIRSASPGYFEAAGIRTVAGRSIDQRDIAEASGVVAINETMSRQFWPTEEAIGKRISLTGPDGPWLSIVGIVADVRHDGPSAPVQPEMDRPFAQEPWPAATIVVRTERDASSLVPELIRTIQTIDPSLALHDVRTMEDVVRRSTERPRLWLALVTGFAGLALALALASVFGMMAYTVGQRMPEFALRIALGADPRRLVVLVLNDGAGVLVTGALAGLATASLTAGLVRPLLFGIGPLAPFVLVSGALLVVATGLCECWLPAQRAAAAMPADLLRGR